MSLPKKQSDAQYVAFRIAETPGNKREENGLRIAMTALDSDAPRPVQSQFPLPAGEPRVKSKAQGFSDVDRGEVRVTGIQKKVALGSNKNARHP